MFLTSMHIVIPSSRLALSYMYIEIECYLGALAAAIKEVLSDPVIDCKHENQLVYLSMYLHLFIYLPIICHILELQSEQLNEQWISEQVSILY